MNFHSINVPIYFVFMGMAWGLGYELSLLVLKLKMLSNKRFMGLFAGTFLSSWIGSKAFFLIFSSGTNFLIHLSSLDFWLGGGFVFFGGLLFGGTFIYFYCLIFKKFNIFSLYCVLPAICFSHAVGRIGCFFSGCCFGKICNLPLNIFLFDGGRHPVQLYESLFLLFLGAFLTIKILKEKNKTLKENFYYFLSIYLISYAIFRFFNEFLRGDNIRGIIFGLSTSQFISLSLIFITLIVLLKDNIKLNKKVFNLEKIKN
ncbi:MAG: hypothetical protein CME68_06070 [Halobacteriovoraceae bacterium]|nr:hypothetical protein [Halobacteriovoraceae bacterium]